MDGPEFDYIRAWSSHWPSCLLCGFMIRTAGNCGSKKSYQKVIGKQLQRAQDHDQVVIPAKKVEEDYLVNYPWLSTCTFRAIVSGLNGQFHLTGICIADWRCGNPDNFAVVPKDSSMARIGARTRGKRVPPGPPQHDPSFIKFLLLKKGDPPLEQQTSAGVGYILHAHCWLLLSQRICESMKPKVESLDLDRLVRTARSFPPAPSWQERNYCSTSNPLVIPRVQSAVALAERAVTRTRKAKTSALQLIQSTQPAQSTHPMNTLPLDIATLIADYICPLHYSNWHASSLRNLLSIFEWTLPESFWRRRIDEELFFELQDIRKSDSNAHFDWQTLRLELMLLQEYTLHHRSGLELRSHVLGALSELMAAYAKNELYKPQRQPHNTVVHVTEEPD